MSGKSRIHWFNHGWMKGATLVLENTGCPVYSQTFTRMNEVPEEYKDIFYCGIGAGIETYLNKGS